MKEKGCRDNRIINQALTPGKLMRPNRFSYASRTGAKFGSQTLIGDIRCSPGQGGSSANN